MTESISAMQGESTPGESMDVPDQQQERPRSLTGDADRTALA